MNHFVLDASVTLAWGFEDQATPYTERVLDMLSSGQALVPFIWPLEVTNALLVGDRRKRLTRGKVARFLNIVKALPISVDGEGARRTFEDILSIARDQDLSAYDAAYLELAVREGLPLATLDHALKKAAHHAGVSLING